MTLCIAWRDPIQSGGKICIASDSSVTIDSTVMPFGGIKVVPIPVRYRWAGSSETWERQFGMGFAGDIASALSLKEMLANILGHLQGIDSPGQFGFPDIIRVIKGAVKVFWSDRKRLLGQNEDVDFFIAGYCPKRRRFRIAKFWVDFESEQTICTEIFIDDREHCDAIGVPSAVERFRTLFELSCSAPPCKIHFAAVRRLRDVINEQISPFVTGAIQYGDFDGEDFRTAATSMLFEEDGRLSLKTFVAGTEESRINAVGGPDGPFILPPTILPFNQDLAAFECETFWSDAESLTPLDELVSLFPYTLEWTQIYLSECEFLKQVLPPGTVFEHVGSSAVPGLPSTGTVDIFAGVRGTPLERPRPFNLSGLCYGYVGSPGRDLRRVIFRRRKRVRVDLIVTEFGGEYWRDAIALRDYLRQDHTAAQKFSRDKGALLNLYANTLVEYNRRKSVLLEECLRKACDNIGGALSGSAPLNLERIE